jgi:hypothetical protein
MLFVGRWGPRLFWEQQSFYGKKGILLMQKVEGRRIRENDECLCWFRPKLHGDSGCKGIKTETERFVGAEETYCIEALMQDEKHYKQERPII